MIQNFINILSEYPVQVIGIIVFLPILFIMIYDNFYNKKHKIDDKVDKYIIEDKDERFINIAVKKTNDYLGDRGDKIKVKLERANILFKKEEYIMLMLVGILIGVLVGFIFFPLASLFKSIVAFIKVPLIQVFVARVLSAVVFGFIGYFTPEVWIQYLIMDRKKLLDQQIPDALMQLAEALRSGASVNLAIKLAGDELKYPMKDEFARLYQELGTGKTFNEAMEDLKTRVNLDDFNFAMSAVQIQNETGAELEPLLREIVKTVGDRKILKKEMQKQIVSSKMQAYILLIAPPLFAVGYSGMNPEMFDQMLKTPLGIVLVIFASISYAIAAFIVLKIIKDITKLT